MKYQVVPSYVWTYPDVTDYPEGKQKAEMLALRSGYSAFQVQFSNICGDEIALSLEGLFGELYRRYGLLYSVISHMIFHLVMMAMLLLM